MDDLITWTHRNSEHVVVLNSFSITAFVKLFCTCSCTKMRVYITLLWWHSTDTLFARNVLACVRGKAKGKLPRVSNAVSQQCDIQARFFILLPGPKSAISVRQAWRRRCLASSYSAALYVNEALWTAGDVSFTACHYHRRYFTSIPNYAAIGNHTHNNRYVNNLCSVIMRRHSKVGIYRVDQKRGHLDFFTNSSVQN